MPKRFGAYLRKLRNEKGLSIRQLEKLSGVSNAYISQIETGKRGFPTPDVLKKIHEPLGVNYDVLMEKAGYISSDTRGDLIPETLKTIDSFEELNELVDNAAELFAEAVTDEDGILLFSFQKYLLSQEPGLEKEELDQLVNDPEIMKKLINHLTLEEKIVFLNTLIKGLVEKNIDPAEVLKSTAQKINENQVAILRVPVLGHIAAGQPILADEHVEEWTEIPNMWNLKPGSAIVLRVKGDSMIGSRIYEGDKVVVKLQQDVENGEIAVVNINGDEATLKRVRKTENGQVILYPDNPKYEPFFITNESARIIGKVIQVMFEPK